MKHKHHCRECGGSWLCRVDGEKSPRHKHGANTFFNYLRCPLCLGKEEKKDRKLCSVCNLYHWDAQDETSGDLCLEDRKKWRTCGCLKHRGRIVEIDKVPKRDKTYDAIRVIA